MLRVTHVDDHALEPVDSITLNETDRHRRRITLTSDKGIEFLLDLSHARQLRHGEGLVLDDGRSNRHLAAEIKADCILIRKDIVIRTMLEQLGATVKHVTAPFNPEGGAYGDKHTNHHHHDE